MNVINLALLFSFICAINANVNVNSKLTQVSSKKESKQIKFVAVNKPANTVSTNWNGPLCIIGGAMAHLTLGTLYCWGNFLSYSPDYLRFFDGGKHEGAQPDALYVIPFTIIAQAIAMPFGPALAKAVGASRALLIGSLIAASAVFIASYQKTLASFIFFYSLMFGAGAGLAYTAPMAAGWKWLPNSKGLVSGGILAGFGSGGFIFSMIGSKFVNPSKVNPKNGKFPSEVYARFPAMLRTLASIYAVVAFFGSLLVSEPSGTPIAVTTTTTTTNKVQDKNKKPVTSSTVTPIVAGLTLQESLKTSQFWLLWSMIIASATAGLNTAAVYKQFAATSTALNGDQYQALVGGIGALCNGFGRLFWGSISDKIGFKNSFTILTILQSISMFVYKYSTASKLAFAANTCMLFFTLAGNFALFPPAIQKLYGPKAGTVIYGVIYSAFALASVVGGILTKKMVKSLGWSIVFQTMGIMSIVATLLVNMLNPVSSFSASVV